MIQLRRTVRSSVSIALAVMIGLAGCSASSSSSDEDVFAGFDALRADIREWNRTAGPFVSAYIDDTVTADQFLTIATPIVTDLEDVVASMHGRDLSAMPPELKSHMDDIVVTYDDKLSALNQILVAVQVGDGDAETAAQANLDRANAAAAKASCAFVQAASELDEQAAEDASAALDALNC